MSKDRKMLKAQSDEALVERTLLDFSEGRISRQRAMHTLGVDYSDLWDMMAVHGVSLPEVSDEEARSEGKKMANFLSTMGA